MNIKSIRTVTLVLVFSFIMVLNGCSNDTSSRVEVFFPPAPSLTPNNSHTSPLPTPDNSVDVFVGDNPIISHDEQGGNQQAQTPIPEAEIVEHETIFGDLVGLWNANTPWGDTGILWEFRSDGTWVRINENNQGSRVYGTWWIDHWGDNLTLIAEGFGWENNTRFHTVRWGDANRVYVTVSGSINPDLILMR
jgi:hypothetical protein